MKPEKPGTEALEKAVAIYFNGQDAPVLLAKGQRDRAAEIIEKAQASEVPVCENAALVELLEKIELGESIPAELYRSVACILSFVYQVTISQEAQESGHAQGTASQVTASRTTGGNADSQDA